MGLAALFTQSASALSPSGASPKATSLSAATMVAEANIKIIEAKIADEPSLKYESDAESEQKFKVAEPTADPSIFDPSKRVQTGRYNDKEMSIAVPFLKRPSKLDGSHAGDVGFDPLGFSENNDMYIMIEAETRHSRLAMLAVVGWPLAELIGPNWMLHGVNNVSPSVMNGFDPLSFLAVAAIFGGFGYFEYKTSLRRVDDKALGKKHAEDMANVWEYGVPGDYNFDPLNLYSALGDSADGRKGMRELEVAHGRAAMLGITYFAIWEALTGHQIVQNNLLFHPNAVVPALAVAYLAFGFFYEVGNDGQYLGQVQLTSEGATRIEGINRKAALAASQNAEMIEKVMGIAGRVAQIAGEIFLDLKGKYESATENYTKTDSGKN